MFRGLWSEKLITRSLGIISTFGSNLKGETLALGSSFKLQILRHWRHEEDRHTMIRCESLEWKIPWSYNENQRIFNHPHTAGLIPEAYWLLLLDTYWWQTFRTCNDESTFTARVWENGILKIYLKPKIYKVTHRFAVQQAEEFNERRLLLLTLCLWPRSILPPWIFLSEGIPFGKHIAPDTW